MFYYGPHVETIVLSSHAQCRQSGQTGLYLKKYRPPLYTIRSTVLFSGQHHYWLYLDHTTSKG